MPRIYARQPRLPLEPLLDALHLHDHQARGVAALAGCDERQVYRWATEGGIPLDTADRVCCAAGLHLALVWPDLYREAA